MFSLFKRNNSESIFVNDIDHLIGKINLVDIREPQEVKLGTIKTAKNIPMGDLLSHPSHYLKKEETYYLMCQSGMRSARTVAELKKLGYQVINVKDGFGTYSGKFRQ